MLSIPGYTNQSPPIPPSVLDIFDASSHPPMPCTQSSLNHILPQSFRPQQSDNTGNFPATKSYHRGRQKLNKQVDFHSTKPQLEPVFFWVVKTRLESNPEALSAELPTLLLYPRRSDDDVVQIAFPVVVVVVKCQRDADKVQYCGQDDENMDCISISMTL